MIMTRIYLDNRNISPIPPGVNSLEQVLGLVEAKHLAANMVIRDVRVDGTHLMRGDEATEFPGDICSRETIEIFTSTLRDVAVDSIREALAYLDRAEAATPLIASGLRRPDDPEAFVELHQFCEGIYFVNLLISRLEKSFQIPLQDVRTSDGDAGQFCIQLAARLKQAIEAHEQNDLHQLADLLEHGIGPLIRVCKEILTSIHARILLE
jgi:hypothetical protein